MTVDEAIEAADSFAEYAEEGTPVFVARILANELRRYREREPLVQALAEASCFSIEAAYDVEGVVETLNAYGKRVRDFKLK